MDVWTWIYISGLVSFTGIAALHVYVGAFDAMKHGKKLLFGILIVCLVAIIVGICGSLFAV